MLEYALSANSIPKYARLLVTSHNWCSDKGENKKKDNDTGSNTNDSELTIDNSQRKLCSFVWISCIALCQ